MSSDCSDERTDAEPLTHAEWAEAIRDGTLLGQRCQSCGHVVATPKSVCADCTSRKLSTIELPTTGTVYSETTIEVTPAGQDNRYQVAIVDLSETRVLGRISGDVQIGDDVSLSGHVEYEEMPGPTFAPVE